MEQKGERLYPSAPLEKDINLEQRLEQKKTMVTALITTSTILKK